MAGHALWVCETYPPDAGGLARAGERISTALQPHCASLRRLVLDRQLSPATASWDEERQLVRLGPLPEEEETLQLVEQYVAHLEPVDLVHAFYGGTLASAAVAGALRTGKPTVVSLRGNDLDRGIYRSKNSALLQWMVPRATALTCVSREQQHKLQLWFGRSDTHYIPNSVDAGQYYPDTPLDDLGEGPIVVFSGEMRWKKGLQSVLEVAHQCRGHFRLALVGGARKAERQILRQEAPEVLQIAYRHDPDWMRRLYARADVVWLPALWEGMPNALLEAMACARPVLANRVGGVAELLDDTRGWSLDLSQGHLHFETLLEILRHPGDKAQKAREFVLQHHRPEAETTAYLNLYRQCSSAW